MSGVVSGLPDYYFKTFSLLQVEKNSKRPVGNNWVQGPALEDFHINLKQMNIGTRLGFEIPSRPGEYLYCFDCDLKATKPEEIKKYQDLVKKILSIVGGGAVVMSGRRNGSCHIYFTSRDVLKTQTLFVSEYKFETTNKNEWEIVLCAYGKQCVLPPSIHPDTAREYVWHRGEMKALKTIDRASLFSRLDQISHVKGSVKPKNNTPGEVPKIEATTVTRKIDSVVVEMLTNVEGVDRSLQCYRVAIELIKRGFSDGEIASILVDEKYPLSDCAMGSTRGNGDREKAVAWVCKYPLAKAKEDILKMISEKVPEVTEFEPWESEEKEKQIDEIERPVKSLEDILKNPDRYFEITDKGTKPLYNLMADDFFNTGDFVFHHEGNHYRYCPEKLHWELFSVSELEHIIQKACGNFYNPSHLENFKKTIIPRLHSTGKKFEDSKGLLNFKNGVFNLKTFELKPHSKNYFFDHITNTNFEPGAKCPLWLKTLNEIFQGNKELIDLMQVIFGYCLLPYFDSLHLAFYFSGGGRNGKSLIIGVLRDLIGENLVSNLSLNDLDDEYRVAMLKSAFINLSEEEINDKSVNSGEFKKATGEGTLIGRYPYGKPMKFVCTTKFIFASNSEPIFKDHSTALEERLIILPFERYFEKEERDVTLGDKLKKEMSGILNWAIEGARIVEKTKQIIEPKICLDAKEKFKYKTDSVYSFIEDNLKFTNIVESKIKKNEIYENYKRYMEKEGGFKLGSKKFIPLFERRLKEIKNLKYKKFVLNIIDGAKGKRASFYEGIEWTSDNDLPIKNDKPEIDEFDF